MVRALLLLLCLVVLAGCGDDDTTSSTDTPGSDDTAAVRTRLDAIGDAVDRWEQAADVATAHAAAEEAANLVVGPNGPGYGDRDGDGAVEGESEAGLLPGSDGTPDGIATPLAAEECVARDVLGRTVDDPATAWAEMGAAIAAWTPSGNTMPTLASHPMRIVGWSTFTIASDDVDEAHEYAGHAQLHVAVARDALDC